MHTVLKCCLVGSYAELISHLHDCFVHLPYVQPCAIIPLHAIVVVNASNG